MPRSVRKTALETRTARLANRYGARPTTSKSPRVCTSATTAARRPVPGSRGAIAEPRYETDALGGADDTLDADGIKVLDFWQAQDAAKKWVEQQRLIEAGVVRRGAYTVRMPSRTTSRKSAARSAPTRSKATSTCSTRSCCRSSVARLRNFHPRSPPEMAQRPGHTAEEGALEEGRHRARDQGDARHRRRPPQAQGHRQPHPFHAEGRAQSRLPGRDGLPPTMPGAVSNRFRKSKRRWSAI